MRITIHAGLFILLVGFINSADSSELRFKPLAQNEALPSPYINQITQLRQGFMLINTSSGARLFDGNRLIEFNLKNRPSISPLNSNIYTTLEDSKGNIWFATSLGLYKFSISTNMLERISHVSQNNNSLIGDNVRVIAEDLQHNLWFGTLNGLSRLNPESNQFTHFSEENLENEPGSLIGIPRVLLQQSADIIWYGTSTGLFQINSKTGQFKRVEGLAGQSNIASGLITHDKQMWFGTHGAGIFKFDALGKIAGQLTQASTPEYGLHSDEIWTLFEGDANKIWIGYWAKGLSVYDPKNGDVFHGVYRQGDQNALPNKYIVDIFGDSSGLVWIATTTGIATFDPINFDIQTVAHIPDDKHSIGNGIILSIEESQDDTVWLGTENGIEHWSRLNNSIEHYYHDPENEHSVTAGPIWDVQLVGENHLLAATDNGIDLLDIQSGEFQHFRSMQTNSSKDFVAAFYSIEAKSSEWFYVSGSDSSVFLFNPFSGEQQLVFDASDSEFTMGVEYFTSTLLSKDGDLWIGSTTGLFRVNTNTQKVEVYSTNEATNLLSDNYIYGLLETDEGVIWAATENGGINKIATDSSGAVNISYITEKQGLPSNRIHNLRSDNKGKIWFVSNKHFGSIDTQSSQVNIYSAIKADHRGFSEGAIKLGANNFIYLGDSRLRRFQPEALKTSIYQPQVRITGITHLHKTFSNFSPLTENNLIELYPVDTLVTFEFSSLDYASPELNQYRYQLVGHDNEWRYPGTGNKASYTHLPASQYQLKVQGTNRDGLWSPNIATLDIIMYPPFYRSYWAYLAYLISGTLILLLLIRAQKNKRKIELESFRAIQKSESRLRDVLWGSGDVLWHWNIETNKIYNTDNSSLESVSKEEIVDFDVQMAKIHPDDQKQTQDKINRHIEGKEDYYESQYRMVSINSNQWSWVISRGRIVEFSKHGKPLIIAGTRKNIDDIKQTEKQLRYLADYDQLTGLSNRSLFHQHLNHSIEIAKRFDEKVALLYLDLDGFKLVNDTHGHAVGDQLLQAVASRLKHALRSIDRCSRLGGDEFAIIIERVKSAEEVLPTIERVLKEISRPFLLGNIKVITSTSVGIAIYPDNGGLSSDLLKHADFAMYEAKRNGKKHYQFYNAEMNALFMNRLSVENELKIALEENQFETFYQARISVIDNNVRGYEALIRWRHPERGLISPAEFIPIAEETGQILDIGEWVLLDGCKQGASWYQQGWRGFISINIAALQFQQSDLVESVKNALAISTLPAECLELEITESTLIKDIELTRNIILKLRKMGIRIALDDFGSGYSSLSYLQQLPIDTLKIDRSFINLIPHSSTSARLCTAIINMAHSLDLKVVAEGIELQEQLKFLREVQCEEYQGFLSAKPLPAQDINIK